MSVQVRPMTDTERAALAAARLVALEFAPYLAHALFATRPVAAEGLGTFAVDRTWRLYVDPEALATWGPREAGAVLVHEVSHLIRDHAERADALGAPIDHERWNLATDAAINDDLIRTGLPLPEGCVTPALLGLPDAGIEESYYAALDPQAPQTEPGCGSGAGDAPWPWEPSPDDPTMPGLDGGQVKITRRRVAQDVQDAMTGGSGRGTIPAGLARWAAGELAAPAVPWRKVLAGMVRRAAALTSGRLTYTYSRPGRRSIPGIVTPAMRAPRITVAAVVDTSGSMSRDNLDAALAEVNGVIKAVGGAVSILTCDAAASAVQTVRSAKDVRLLGGGGTDMRVGIEAAMRATPTPDAVVVLTDGYTPWPDQPTRARLVVVLTEPGALASVPSWARALVLDR